MVPKSRFKNLYLSRKQQKNDSNDTNNIILSEMSASYTRKRGTVPFSYALNDGKKFNETAPFRKLLNCMSGLFSINSTSKMSHLNHISTHRVLATVLRLCNDRTNILFNVKEDRISFIAVCYFYHELHQLLQIISRILLQSIKSYQSCATSCELSSTLTHSQTAVQTSMKRNNLSIIQRLQFVSKQFIPQLFTRINRLVAQIIDRNITHSINHYFSVYSNEFLEAYSRKNNKKDSSRYLLCGCGVSTNIIQNADTLNEIDEYIRNNVNGHNSTDIASSDNLNDMGVSTGSQPKNQHRSSPDSNTHNNKHTTTTSSSSSSRDITTHIKAHSKTNSETRILLTLTIILDKYIHNTLVICNHTPYVTTILTVLFNTTLQSFMNCIVNNNNNILIDEYGVYKLYRILLSYQEYIMRIKKLVYVTIPSNDLAVNNSTVNLDSSTIALNSDRHNSNSSSSSSCACTTLLQDTRVWRKVEFILDLLNKAVFSRKNSSNSPKSSLSTSQFGRNALLSPDQQQKWTALTEFKSKKRSFSVANSGIFGAKHKGTVSIVLTLPTNDL